MPHAGFGFEILLIIALLSVSATMSGTETALFSLNRAQLQLLKSTRGRLYNRIQKLLARPDHLLATILIGNEVVNIMMGVIITGIYNRMLPPDASGGSFGLPHWLAVMIASVATMTPVIFIFGEITPKIISARNSLAFASLVTPPVYTLYRILAPLRHLVTIVPKTILSVTGKNTEAQTAKLTEEEVMAMIDEGRQTGVIDAEEHALIENVFEFDDSTAREVMTPVSKVMSFSQDVTIRHVLQKLRNPLFSRIPVYSGSTRNITGVLYTKDLLPYHFGRDNPDIPVSKIMRTPFLTSPATRLNVLFKRMKEEKTHISIVTNPASLAIGIVTMDDLLDRIFGEVIIEKSKED